MRVQDGLSLVHNTLVGVGLSGKIRMGASGKIVRGNDIEGASALGTEWCKSERGYMFEIG